MAERAAMVFYKLKTVNRKLDRLLLRVLASQLLLQVCQNGAIDRRVVQSAMREGPTLRK
jgi:hypothetical protein